jgi:hypothetical protein
MSVDDDEEWYRYDEAMSKFEEEILQETSKESIKTYLGTYGDAITKRIECCLASASKLLSISEYEAALLRAFTGIELIIKFQIILPILHGAILQNQIAEILVSKILFERGKNYNHLLKSIVQLYGINLDIIHFKDGKNLWKTITDTLTAKRNRIIHIGEQCTLEDSELAINCLQKMEKDIVLPIASKLGFSLEITGKWSEIIWGDRSKTGTASGYSHYEQKNPF